MQRNWDTIRIILERLEEEQGLQFQLYPKDFAPIDNDETVHHLKLLHRAGLIEGIPRDHLTGPPSYVATGITWEGYELLSAMKSKNVWNKVKDTSSRKGIDLSFEAIKVLVRLAIETLVK